MNVVKGHINFTFIVLLLLGIVIGGFVGEYLGNFPSMEWLKYGKDFGMVNPLVIDLGVLKFQFALSIKFTVMGIVGLIVSFIIYKKM